MNRAVLIAFVLGLGGTFAPLSGQEFRSLSGPTTGQVALLGLSNVLILTGAAALKALLVEEQDVTPTVIGAAAGSTVHFAGKALAARGAAPAGLLGRYAAAVGSSVTGNAVAGRPAMECISVPLGPLWLNLSNCERPRLTIDVPTAAAAVSGLSEGSFDLERSLETGSLVFRGGLRDGPATVGWAFGGVVFYQASGSGPAAEEHRVRHELTHVIQHDMAALAFSRPLEARVGQWLASQGGTGHRRLDLGLYVPIGLALDRTPLRLLDRLEREARILDGTGR